MNKDNADAALRLIVLANVDNHFNLYRLKHGKRAAFLPAEVGQEFLEAFKFLSRGDDQSKIYGTKCQFLQEERLMLFLRHLSHANVISSSQVSYLCRLLWQHFRTSTKDGISDGDYERLFIHWHDDVFNKGQGNDDGHSVLSDTSGESAVLSPLPSDCIPELAVRDGPRNSESLSCFQLAAPGLVASMCLFLHSSGQIKDDYPFLELQSVVQPRDIQNRPLSSDSKHLPNLFDESQAHAAAELFGHKLSIAPYKVEECDKQCDSNVAGLVEPHDPLFCPMMAGTFAYGDPPDGRNDSFLGLFVNTIEDNEGVADDGDHPFLVELSVLQNFIERQCGGLRLIGDWQKLHRHLVEKTDSLFLPEPQTFSMLYTQVRLIVQSVTDFKVGIIDGQRRLSSLIFRLLCLQGAETNPKQEVRKTDFVETKDSLSSLLDSLGSVATPVDVYIPSDQSKDNKVAVSSLRARSLKLQQQVDNVDLRTISDGYVPCDIL